MRPDNPLPRLGRHLVAATLALIFLARPATALDADRAPFRPQAGQELTRDLSRLVEENRIPAAAVALVSRDGVLWAGQFGSFGPEHDKSVTPHTPFRVGSISKSLTALGVLRLVEAGRLDLRTPVSELLPEIEIPNPWDDTDPVRLVHLLEHTSGIEDQHFHDVYNLDDPPDIAIDFHRSYSNSGQPTGPCWNMFECVPSQLIG